jgi:hypothetical protein
MVDSELLALVAAIIQAGSYAHPDMPAFTPRDAVMRAVWLLREVSKAGLVSTYPDYEQYMESKK